MTTVRPFTPADHAALRVQPAQAREAAAEIASDTAALSFSVRDGAGRVIACAGFSHVHDGHAIVWAELADELGSAMVGLTRAVRRHLATAPWRRLTAVVRADWDEAHRWALALGFRCEGVMRAYGEGGEDYAVYGRIGIDHGR